MLGNYLATMQMVQAAMTEALAVLAAQLCTAVQSLLAALGIEANRAWTSKNITFCLRSPCVCACKD